MLVRISGDNCPLTLSAVFFHVSITLAPPLMILLLRGRFRKEGENPVNRLLIRIYLPAAKFVVKRRKWVILGALVMMLATIPIFMSLGSEFMPPLDEGSLLVMPTTFAGISIEEARRALNYQHRIIMGFPEVASVHGKAGRAETATDPAQLEMNESVISLQPRDKWPKVPKTRWYSNNVPDWFKPAFRLFWPDSKKRSIQELAMEMSMALQMPGYQMSVSPPIRTRIDMLSTGVRTPVGIKVFGDSLAEIERISIELEGLLRNVPGTLSTFAERQTGREYIDITPDRDIIARYGLTVADVNDIVESAIGGMPVSTVISGRSRFSVNLRYAAGFRTDPEAIRRILIPVQISESQFDFGSRTSGSGTPTGSGGSSMGGNATSGNQDAMSSNSTMGNTQMDDTGPQGAMPPSTSNNDISRWEQPGAAITLGSIADVRVVTGPPIVLGLMPLLWESGVGADVTARTAAPVVGGLWSAMLLTLLVLPAAYTVWRRRQMKDYDGS